MVPPSLVVSSAESDNISTASSSGDDRYNCPKSDPLQHPMLSLCEESNLRRDLRRLDFCMSDLLDVEEEEEEDDDSPSPREKVDDRALRKLARRDVDSLLLLSPLLGASSKRTDMVEGGCFVCTDIIDEGGDASRPLRLFTNQPDLFFVMVIVERLPAKFYSSAFCLLDHSTKQTK